MSHAQLQPDRKDDMWGARMRTERGSGEPEHHEERQPWLRRAWQVIVPVEDAHGHDVKGEERADGDQVEQAVEGREEGDDGCVGRQSRRSVAAGT